MTTKILTFRVPASVYSGLCTNAAELGVSVSAHVRRLIEQEHHAEQVELLRTDLFERLICIDLSSCLLINGILVFVFLQCVGSRTDGFSTVDQSDMRGLVTA